MIDPSDLIKESKRGGKGNTPFGDDDLSSPDKRKPAVLPGVNVGATYLFKTLIQERMRQNLLAGVEELIDRNVSLQI